MQHPHCTSTTSRSVSPKLSCCLALYYACVALPIVRVVYELLAIVVMHLVPSSQCSLMYDEHHSKWHHYVQPKFAKEVKPPDQQCLSFLNYNHDMYNVRWSVLGVIRLLRMIGMLLWVLRWRVKVSIGQDFQLCGSRELELWAVWQILFLIYVVAIFFKKEKNP